MIYYTAPLASLPGAGAIACVGCRNDFRLPAALNFYTIEATPAALLRGDNVPGSDAQGEGQLDFKG